MDPAIVGSIAILYPFFFYKLVDYMTYKERPRNLSYCGAFTECSAEEQMLADTWSDHEKNRDLIMMIVLLTIGILTIAISGFIKSGPTKLGVGLGGLLCVFISILFYWHRYKEPVKLIIIGAALVSVIMISVRATQIEKYSDILVPSYN